MPKAFLILVLAAALSACAGTATDANAKGDSAVTGAAEGDDAVTASAETKKPKKRCYRDITTGSRVGARVCN